MDAILSGEKYNDSTQIEGQDDEGSTDADDTDADGEDKTGQDADTSQADTGEGEESEPGDDADMYEEIDPRLVAAAKRFGWSDEKIIRVAEEDETILEDLANLLDMVTATSSGQQGQKSEEKSAESSDDVKGVEELKLSDEELRKLKREYGEAPAKVIAALTEKLNSTIKELNEVKQNVHGVTKAEQEREIMTRLEAANRAFDDAAEVFPILGKTSELLTTDGKYDMSHPSIKARDEIFNVALSFERMGYSFEQAMDEALNWYAGKEGTKQIEEQVVKKLNARKKQFTARPTRKHTERKFASEDERIYHTMGEFYEKFGIKEE